MTQTKDYYDKETNDKESIARVGVKGVHLKKFEQVVADLLASPLTLRFVELPPIPATAQSEDWPFDCVPSAARVTGDEPGKLTGIRAVRKEGQIRSMLRCIVPMLPTQQTQQTTIVDFCGGSGHTALPLALLLPHCKVVVVDIGSRSLQLLHEKALRCVQQDGASNSESSSSSEDSCMNDAVERQQQDATYQEQVERQCAGIPNLYTYHGSIETYSEHFDIGVALHACGEATDVTLRACARVGANFVVCPCCVGKLHYQRMNPYIYHATAANAPTISYPQSSIVRECIQDRRELWNHLARAADYSDLQELRTPRNANRRTAKALLEMDRLMFMANEYGYQTALTRMQPWESSCKNDILLGWHDRIDGSCVQSPYHECAMKPDDECNADVELSKLHLLERSKAIEDCVDWTRQEEEQVREQLIGFINGDERQLTLPPIKGARRRRLVHYVAEDLNLRHWGHGKKNSEKTVVVAKRRDVSYHTC